MELRHLRYFCAVADNEGFSRTARLMHVSQSAISEQIQNLEQEIGVPLLVRAGHRIRLTSHGEVFLAEARKVLAGASSAVELAQRSLRGETGTLKIGFFNGGTGPLFPELMRDFRRRYPGVRLTLAEMVPRLQTKALLDGTLDIGITRPPDAPYDQQLRTCLLYLDPLAAVLPKDHPLAKGAVDLRALAAERFVLVTRETSSALFDKIIEACSRAGFSPDIVNTGSVWSSVVLFVQSGEGISILPRTLEQSLSGTRGLAFCPLTDTSASIEMVAAWSPSNEGPIQTAFLQLLNEARPRMQAAVRKARPGVRD
jgi:DNA-binding transcriptional LysR family regulator